jgi:hypothetical protein
VKIVVISQQSAFVRHYGRWYRVQRAGEDWKRLPIGQKYVKPKKFDLNRAANSLKKSVNQMPEILDEAKADEEVKKVISKHNKVDKKSIL